MKQYFVQLYPNWNAWHKLPKHLQYLLERPWALRRLVRGSVCRVLINKMQSWKVGSWLI